MIETTIHENGVAVVTMARGRVNAMNLEFCEGMATTFEQLAANDQVVAAVLQGNRRVFSAGVDLKEVSGGDDDYLDQYLPALIHCFKTVFQFPKPLVAAVEGHAIAGGCVLATACDFRLIHPEAKIGLPELRIGVPLPSAGIEIMRFAVSPEALRSMVNVGKTFTGVEAVKVGLADGIEEGNPMELKAVEAAKGLTVVPANVYALSKQQQRAPAMRNLLANEADFEQQVFEIWKSEENRKVVQRYVDERL